MIPGIVTKHHDELDREWGKWTVPVGGFRESAVRHAPPPAE